MHNRSGRFFLSRVVVVCAASGKCWEHMADFSSNFLLWIISLRPVGSDPEVVCQKNSFLKVSVSLGGYGPSVAHGKHCVRRRYVQATKTRQKLALSLTPLGAVRAAAEGTGYKNRRLGKSRGVRFDSRLVKYVRCDTLWAWNGRSVFLLALLSVSGNTHAVSLLHAS